MSVRIENGKYEFIKHENNIEIKRAGEFWHFQEFAYNAIVGMMMELDAARVVLNAVRTAIAEDNDNDEFVPVGIKNAMRHHDSLVDDRELPSEWTDTDE